MAQLRSRVPDLLDGLRLSSSPPSINNTFSITSIVARLTSDFATMDKNPHGTDGHPLSEKETNTDDSKLSTAIAAVTDPKFPLPVLNDKSSTLRYILSFGTLAALLATGIVGAWYLDVTMLQSQSPTIVLSCAFFAVLGALFFTGTVWIDWFELVLGYWWLSMPIGAAAGLVLVMNQEASMGIHESD
jgi:hypothetical protein